MSVSSFTQRDILCVLALAKGLSACTRYGRWFKQITDKGEKCIVLESISSENGNDWMDINEGAAAIQKVQTTVPAIVPRTKTEYVVFIPHYIHSTNHWEPDDVDLKEVGRFDSLSEAFSEFYMMEARTFTDDNAQAVAYEMSANEADETEDV